MSGSGSGSAAGGSLLSLPGKAPRIADRDSGRDNNFNLIRLLAATGVLVSHAWPISLGAGTEEPLAGILHGTTLGAVCVYIFFSISGFFIARSFARRSHVVAFLKARARRLLPALAVVLTLTVLAMGPLVSEAPQASYWRAVPGYWLHNLTLFFPHYELPGVFAHNPYGPSINGSLWSLSYEVVCYIGVLICGVLGLLPHFRRFAWMLVAVGVFYALSTVVPLPYRLDQLARLALPFGIGTGFWVARAAVPLSLPLAILLGLAAVLAWFSPLFVPVFILALAYWVFILGYARIPALSDQGFAAPVRHSDYSYGIYIYAFPVQQLLASAGAVWPLLNIALALPATLVCAMLSWHLVEAPALRSRRRRA